MFLPVEDVEDEGVTSAQRKIRREKELRAARARVALLFGRCFCALSQSGHGSPCTPPSSITLPASKYDLRGVEIMFLPVEDVEDEGVTSAQRKIRREKELRESARCVPPREEVVAPARSVDHTVCRHIEDGPVHRNVEGEATRAFVTGCFKEDLTNDLRGVEIMFLPVEDVEDGPVHRNVEGEVGVCAIVEG
jgi:hypothetical protein